MIAQILIWGFVLVLGFGIAHAMTVPAGCRARQLALTLLLALIWPGLAIVVVGGALIDFARFAIAVAKKPH